MPAEKTVQIHFRVTSSEYESIKNNADKSGLSLSEYARRSLVGEKVMAAPARANALFAVFMEIFLLCVQDIAAALLQSHLIYFLPV